MDSSDGQYDGELAGEQYGVRDDEHGRTLNLGSVGGAMDGEAPEAEADAPALREVTDEDLVALAQVEDELRARWPETIIDPTLERIELLMDLLGEPQKACKVIHVAGTNGKTSTVRMIESLLRAFGNRVGRTTSPHLQMVTERIGIDGEPIHPADFVRIYREIEPYIQMVDERTGTPMSYFEVMVALAFAAFADAPVDVAVVEVGMGGRWDATNVVDADVDVIMPVGLDHTDYLGDTIEAIAAEKAGIVRSPDAVTVIADQEPEAMRVILERTVEVGAPVARLGREFDVVKADVAVGGQLLTLRGLSGEVDEVFLPLAGEHQARNAAVALAAVEAFYGAGGDRTLDHDTIRAGFAQATSPGRLERVAAASTAHGGGPTVFIDATHNPHGARALAKAIERDFDFTRLIGVLGILGDKDARGIFEALEPVLDEVIVTQNSSPRATDAYELAEVAREVFGEERVIVEKHVPAAYELAVERTEDNDGAGVLITGSVVTAGEARAMFGKDPK